MTSMIWWFLNGPLPPQTDYSYRWRHQETSKQWENPWNNSKMHYLYEYKHLEFPLFLGRSKRQPPTNYEDPSNKILEILDMDGTNIYQRKCLELSQIWCQYLPTHPPHWGVVSVSQESGVRNGCGEEGGGWVGGVGRCMSGSVGGREVNEWTVGSPHPSTYRLPPPHPTTHRGLECLTTMFCYVLRARLLNS